MSATALSTPAHPSAVPKPSTVASGAARGTPRRDQGGRFTPRATYPCCEGCSWMLAESLAGRWFCANGKCGAYRTDVGAVPGVDAGALAVGT